MCTNADVVLAAAVVVVAVAPPAACSSSRRANANNANRAGESGDPVLPPDPSSGPSTVLNTVWRTCNAPVAGVGGAVAGNVSACGATDFVVDATLSLGAGAGVFTEGTAFGALSAAAAACGTTAALAAGVTGADTEDPVALNECLEPWVLVDAGPVEVCVPPEPFTAVPPDVVVGLGECDDVEVAAAAEGAAAVEGAAAPDAPDDDIPSVLDGGAEPPAAPSAWAIPDPLASAAPTPNVSAPAPSQA